MRPSGAELAEVDSLERDLIALAHHPRESEHGVVRVDAARLVDRVSGHHRLKSTDVRDERGAAVDGRGRIVVDAVVGPRSFEQRGALRVVGLVPRCAVGGDDLVGVHHDLLQGQ